MSTPPPLEHKSAPAMLAPRPGRTGTPARPVPGSADVDPDTGEVTALAAVTGIVDDVGDIISVGALARALARRTPRLVVGHDWQRLAGRITDARELPPGDPLLPRTAPDGTPWPPQAGALWIRAEYLPTREGREQREIARAFGTSMAYSIGYQVADGAAEVKAGVRRIRDLDIYEVSPVLHGANRYATQLSVKSAGAALETKTTASALRSTLVNATCGVCGRSAAAAVDDVPPGRVLLCPTCTGEVDDLTGYLSRNRDDADQDDPEQDDPDDDGPSMADLDGAPGADGDDQDESHGTAESDDPDDGTDYGDARDLLTHLQCALCGQPAGAQIGGMTSDQDVYCPACTGAIMELADDLADAAAGDDDRPPSTADEYRAALVEQTEYDMAGDGTLTEAPDDPATGRAWRQR